MGFYQGILRNRKPLHDTNVQELIALYLDSAKTVLVTDECVTSSGHGFYVRKGEELFVIQKQPVECTKVLKTIDTVLQVISTQESQTTYCLIVNVQGVFTPLIMHFERDAQEKLFSASLIKMGCPDFSSHYKNKSFQNDCRKLVEFLKMTIETVYLSGQQSVSDFSPSQRLQDSWSHGDWAVFDLFYEIIGRPIYATSSETGTELFCDSEHVRTFHSNLIRHANRREATRVKVAEKGVLEMCSTSRREVMSHHEVKGYYVTLAHIARELQKRENNRTSSSARIPSCVSGG